MDVFDQTTIDDMSEEEDITPLPVTDYETMANNIMPDLGQEIEDFKYNTWHVTNWRNLEERITGPEFEAGNWKWRILLFPFGNNNQDVVSIYLDFADMRAPEGWHSCVQFALVLWNPEDPTQYIYHHAHHRFTAEESDWGFTRFYCLRRLLTPYGSRTRAIIENDSANITAFVRVFKDPTGVLWHNFIKYYDSKKETGYVGLKNQGATSYMNSLLQSLYCTTYFRKAVYQIPTKDDVPIKSVSLALQRIFYQLQISNTPVKTTELTKSFGWDSAESFVQHDVQEFNRVLQNNLEGKMKNTKADGAITKLFVGKMKSYIKCDNVDYESSCVEDYYDIQLNVKGCKTLRDSFKDYIQEETLEGNNKYQAEGYGLQDAKKGVIFESFPPVLHLQLKRFEYDYQSDTMVKINDRHEFPMEIDLEEFLSENADKSGPHKYLLHGVLVHCGDSHEGHYFALLKPEKDGKWFKFHDDRITRVVDKEVLEDNYGDEYLNANIIKVRSTKIHKRFTNAYMLVYIRESHVDEILSPVVPEDIPEHLQKRLEQERAIEEQKRKEMEERHLYLTVKIVTTEKFKVHQGFDLANFDDRQYPLSEVYVYKILKSDAYRSFKDFASRNFNIPPERVRFWVFVNRQNRTVRLDAPIPELYINTSMEQICANMTTRRNGMELYMEVADKPIKRKKWFPTVPKASRIIVFLKYFDPDKQTLEGLGHLYIQKFGKVGDITRVLCEKKEFPPDTPLKIYEEVKPNMIEEMHLEFTFQQSEIQDGDIICFQKALTEREIQEHRSVCRCWNIPHFYESLALRIVVSFKPKLEDRYLKPELTYEQVSYSEFDLILNKKWTYDQVSGAVATHLNTDPLKLRFTTAHSTSSTPKSVIKRTTAHTLSEMLQTVYLSPSAYVLFYEMLNISIVELETIKFIEVYWLGNAIKDEEAIDLCLPKNAIVNDIKKFLKNEKVTLSSPYSRIRLFEVHHNKIQKEYTGTEPIERIQEHATLYAEEIPHDEIYANQNDRIIQVYHFTKDPLCLHGIPFKFVIKNGETLADTKVRLRHRLGMSEIDFLKVNIAIMPGTSYAKSTYLFGDDIILSEMKLSNEDCLGLDHPDKTGRTEKVIFIRG
ncbi:unnamed protein product [Rhizophagus irregularis]|nr:unnamed protein product [Rhizophagus irregularis]